MPFIMKDLLIKNTLLTGIVLTLTGLTRIVYNVVIGKSFGAEVLGQINLIISVVMLFSMFISTILENSATKFLSEYFAKKDEKIIRNIFTMLQTWAIVGSFVLIIIAFIFRGYIASKVRVDEELFIVALPLIFLIATHHFYRGCFYGLNNVDKYFRFEIASSILLFVILGAIVFVRRYNLLLPFITYYALFSIISMFSLRTCLIRHDKSFDLRKQIGTYGTIAMVGTLASSSMAQIANIITGSYLSPECVGFYSAAVSITMILQFAPSVMGRVLLPSVSYIYGMNDIQILKKVLDKTTIWLSIAALFLGGISIILSKKILIILFSPDFTVATFSLQTLILGICLATITVPAVSVLSGSKYIKIPNVAGVFGLLACLAIWPYLIPRFGINGTATGYVIGIFVNSIIPLYYAKKYFGLELKRVYFITLISILLFTLAIFIENIVPMYPDWIASSIFAIMFIMIFKKDIFEICNNMRPKYT